MAGDDERGDRRRRHQEVILDLTTDADVVGGNFEAAARTITETATEIVSSTRVSIWLFDDDGDRLRCVDRYDRRTGEHDADGEIVAADHPAYFEALHTHRSIDVTDVRSDPRTRGLIADYLEPRNIVSLLDATLRVEGDVIGVVCHEHVGTTREWTDDDVQFASDVADVVHRALRNHRSVRQRQELEFRWSLLKAQQEAIPDGVLVVDGDGEILSYNARFEALWDLPEAVLETGTGDDVFEHVRQQVAAPGAFAEQVEHLVETPTATSHAEVALADGRTFELYSTPVRGDSRQYGRLWMSREITDRKARETELELKNRAMDEAPIGITLSDPDRSDNPLVYANDQFERLTGYARSAVLGRNCRFLQGEGTAAEPVAAMRAAVETEEPTTVELRNYRNDGSEFWNRVTIAPVSDDQGTVTHYVGFQQDVTDRKEATRQLRVLHRVLRHNLSNQLGVVRGTAEQLATETSGEVATAATTIVDEIDSLLAVTDKHREIVRLLSERPAPDPVDVDDVLRPALERVRTDHPRAALAVEHSIGDTVLAIPAIETAFGELLENAVVYSEANEPTVEVGVDRGPETVRVRIADSGPGLPEAEAEILAGDQTVEPLYHGLGMGLWLVYWIVTLSRGSITVVETGSAGTTIVVELPRVDAD
ncbi:PAS domain-containing protein [Halosolutus amylolyticus]|uniref:PAS domain-containing protein n=1 Tax=Halosolutus amylolyticus TaxID=2932267 RepID=A0ABD5PQP8_9EURY|nr:PAS domain-containing protein [Halosolutus amylolyticus]